MTVWIVTNGTLINSVWNSHGGAAARADSLNGRLGQTVDWIVAPFKVQETG